MASSIYPLAFEYVKGECSAARLAHLSFTDETNSSRVSVSIEHDICTNISYTDGLDSTEKQLKYVSNPKGPSPLLLVVPNTLNRLKLEVDVSHVDCAAEQEASLVIHKLYGTGSGSKSAREQMQDSITSKSGDASKISLSELSSVDRSQHVIVNDTFSGKKAQNTMLTVSMWKHSETESVLIFSFQIWVEESPPDTRIAPLADELQSSPRPSNIPEIGLQDLRKAFNFNIHDGPEFRTTLAAYEQNCPKLKKAMLNFQDEVRGLESSLKRLLVTRNRILETIESVIKYSFSPLLQKLEIHRSFSVAFKRVFEPFERNLNFVIKEVFAVQSIPKMNSSCISSTNADGSYEPASSRKSFEKQSKEFYDWLHKYLSNEKDRPESKLLAKRKGFELSKFDYLNALNTSSNNQYFNQLLENFFKFSNLPQDRGILDYGLFKDSKKSQGLLSGNASLYLNGLSRFNSEKLQLRQMIEACRTNEELTTLIKTNALNTLSAHQNEKSQEKQKLRIDTTSLNLDMIFPSSPANSSPADNYQAQPWRPIENDQNANFAGILYALGGQGKPGWHKEWVVLEKGQLIEYSDWRNGTQPINRPIDIALASVKPVTKDKRQYCLEIITSLGQKHVFQAINDDERNQWIKALYNAGQLTDRLIKKAPRPREIKDLPPPPTQILPSGDGRGSPVSVFSESFRVNNDDFLQSVRAIEASDNSQCADCKSTDSTEWISMTFSVVICVKCSSCHRNMGSHISKVRSLKLDNFVDESRVLLKFTNNALANSYLEANAPEKLTPEASDAVRLRYIRQKYEQRAFMAPAVNMNSMLVKATRKIDIDEVIKWLNCGADPNLTLQMSNPQWAEPLTVTLFEYSLRKKIEVEENGEEKSYFVISELLLFHGCNIETIDKLHAQVVVGEDARAYWTKRRARAMAT